MHTNYPEERQHFDAAMQILFEAKSPDAHSCFLYLQRLLYQFRLSKIYEVKDILVEVYARGVKLIEAGENIRSPYAWVKRVGLNVIREFRREAEKISYYDFDSQPQLAQISEDLLSEFVFQNDLKAMQIAFKKLSPKDQNILHLRVVNGLTWGEIADLLVADEAIDRTEGTLRQRGYRALQRLRKIYGMVREEFRIDVSGIKCTERLDDEIMEYLPQSTLHQIDSSS